MFVTVQSRSLSRRLHPIRTIYSSFSSRKFELELAPCSGTPPFLMSITIHHILGSAK
jgi:hypothetical protein